MPQYDIIWSPEGRRIATVDAVDAKSAIRKAPQPYRRYLGELYATPVTHHEIIVGNIGTVYAGFDERTL